MIFGFPGGGSPGFYHNPLKFEKMRTLIAAVIIIIGLMAICIVLYVLLKQRDAKIASLEKEVKSVIFDIDKINEILNL